MSADILQEQTIGSCRLIRGDSRDMRPARIDSIITDPPYGMGDLLRKGGKKQWSVTAGKGTRWDERPDLGFILKMDLPTIIWGGQFFGLPIERGWLVWDKMMSEFTTSVCELAWTNLDFPVRRVSIGSGMVQIEGREHPTQKPVQLMTWCIGHMPKAKHVYDPFMGSGTTGVACVKRGLSFTGVEITQEHFDLACRRIETAYRQPDMLVEQPKPIEQTELWTS